MIGSSSFVKVVLLGFCIVFTLRQIGAEPCSVLAICNCEAERLNDAKELLQPPVLPALPSSSFNIKVAGEKVDFCKNIASNSTMVAPIHVNLNCSYVDPSKNHTKPPTDLDKTSFYLTLNTECDTPTSTAPPTPAPPDDAHGYSTGSVLLIIFFTLLFAYMSLGIAVNFFIMGARGVEIVPNLSFWRDLPSLVKDGAVFVQNGFKVPHNDDVHQRSPESYDAI